MRGDPVGDGGPFLLRLDEDVRDWMVMFHASRYACRQDSEELRLAVVQRLDPGYVRPLAFAPCSMEASLWNMGVALTAEVLARFVVERGLVGTTAAELVFEAMGGQLSTSDNARCTIPHVPTSVTLERALSAFAIPLNSTSASLLTFPPQSAAQDFDAPPQRNVAVVSLDALSSFLHGPPPVDPLEAALLAASAPPRRSSNAIPLRSGASSAVQQVGHGRKRADAMIGASSPSRMLPPQSLLTIAHPILRRLEATCDRHFHRVERPPGQEPPTAPPPANIPPPAMTPRRPPSQGMRKGDSEGQRAVVGDVGRPPGPPLASQQPSPRSARRPPPPSAESPRLQTSRPGTGLRATVARWYARRRRPGGDADASEAAKLYARPLVYSAGVEPLAVRAALAGVPARDILTTAEPHPW